MKKTIKAQSGHTLFIESVRFEDLPAKVKKFQHIKDYKKFYVVKNWDSRGVVFFYLGSGYKTAPKEIVVWYRNGGFWSSFGTNFQTAIDGAQKDGWMWA